MNLQRIALVAAASVCMLLASAKSFAQTPDYSNLTSKNHPRLFFTEKGFKDLSRDIKKGDNMPLVQMHESLMAMAEKDGLSDTQLTFDHATAKETFNGMARKFAHRIITAAYAYRMTRDRNYLDHVISNIDRFADNFDAWTTGYWLENSEVCFSFGIAYDWLYKALPQATKDKIISAIESIGYEDAKDEKKAWFYNSWHNWNPVCNASLVCAAIGTYERHPEESAAVIEKALATVPTSLKGIYEPDGASPEGPSYWDYASNFETQMMFLLEDNFGTDFGLSDYEGFKRGADYRVFAIGNRGQWFNYADCNPGLGDNCMALWYYAWKYGRKDLVFREIAKLEKSHITSSRAIFMTMACAMRMGSFETRTPDATLYVGHGEEINIVIARSGWEKDDAYLGLKGGKGKTNHSHLDEGSFVFESNGVRWADEFAHPGYELYRRAQKSLKKEGKSFKWYDKFVYNNRRHSTLTVNDHDMNDEGFASITGTFDTPERRGGTIDLSDMLKNDLASACRTAAIVNGRDLEVTDELVAPEGKGAHVRWTLVTGAKIELTPNGIILSKDGRTATVKANVPVEYKTWSSDPKDYDDSPVRAYESKLPKYWMNLCGFEFDIPASGKVSLVTTISSR